MNTEYIYLFTLALVFSVPLYVYMNNLWNICCGVCKNRKRPYLFYFNIMKCASPVVLLEFQCPTTQVPVFVRSVRLYSY